MVGVVKRQDLVLLKCERQAETREDWVDSADEDLFGPRSEASCESTDVLNLERLKLAVASATGLGKSTKCSVCNNHDEQKVE